MHVYVVSLGWTSGEVPGDCAATRPRKAVAQKRDIGAIEINPLDVGLVNSKQSISKCDEQYFQGAPEFYEIQVSAESEVPKVDVLQPILARLPEGLIGTTGQTPRAVSLGILVDMGLLRSPCEFIRELAGLIKL